MADILVIDDDGHIREVVRFALEQAGHTVTEAPQGAAAIELFSRGSFDLLVLDILIIELSYGVLPPQTEDLRRAPADSDDPRAAAARRLRPMIERAQVFNLSAVRILDADGCVLVTTGGESDVCMDTLAEVSAALGGSYAAVARQRISDTRPLLSDASRRGTIRIFTALPVFSDGEVIGVVRLSRTSLDAWTSLWRNRRGLIVVVGATVVLTVLVSLLFARSIVRPLRAITDAAQRIAGGHPETLPTLGWMPAEVASLSEALDRMTHELGHRAQYIADFASNMSHELKTPLTAS